MYFTYYTDKTIAQSLSALNDRMHVKGTPTRPEIDGWVQKSGEFELVTRATVARYFTRKTTLYGRLEREGSVTTVHCTLSTGANRENKIVIYIALALIALLLFGNGYTVPALIILPISAILYIPLTGDYENSQYLLSETQKTLKAKVNAPKTSTRRTAAKS